MLIFSHGSIQFNMALEAFRVTALLYWPRSLGGQLSPPPWKINPQWLSLIPEENLIELLLVEFFKNNKVTASTLMVWGAMKVYLQGVMINQAEQEFITDPTYEGRLVWQAAQKIYRNLSLTKAENTRFFSKSKTLWDRGAGRAYAGCQSSSRRGPNSYCTS